MESLTQEDYTGTYVVGDLHGCFDEWIAFKESIEEFDSGDVLNDTPFLEGRSTKNPEKPIKPFEIFSHICS